jgi:hypothetical protein
MRACITWMIFSMAGWSGLAGAQTLAQKAQADSLFDEAKKDMAAGKLAEACAAFESSYKLAQRLGTELNLADCYSKIGRSASAWAAFREAQSIASKAGDARADFAQQQATLLEPRLNHIVVAADPAAKDVALDGQPVDPVMLGHGLPVDAGKHTVSATFSGGRFEKSVDVAGEAQTINVDVKPEGLVKLPPPPSAPHAVEPRGSGMRTAGFVIGGAGAALLVTSGVLTVATLTTWSGAKSDCPNNLCNDAGWKTYNRAAGFADGATVTLIAGGVCAATGAILYLAGKPRAETTVAPTALRGGAALFVSGSF